jgi:hypothetical protein
MRRTIRPGDCVRIPDGRIGRVRGASRTGYRVRVRRKTSKTHQFLVLSAAQIKAVDCPDGWMSPTGYRRYLRITLAKMRARKSRADARSAGRSGSV